MSMNSTGYRSRRSQDSRSASRAIVDRTYADLLRFGGYDRRNIYVVPSFNEDGEPQFGFSVFSHQGLLLDAGTRKTLRSMKEEGDGLEQIKKDEDEGLEEDEFSTLDYRGVFLSSLVSCIPEGSKVQLLPERTQIHEMVAHGFKRMVLPWDEMTPEEEAISELLTEALKLLGEATDGNEQGDRITA